MLVLGLICLAIILILCGYVCYTDIKKRLIYNKTAIALLVAVIPFAFVFYQQLFILPALVTLVVGFVLFNLRVIGAGDIKMLSVLMLSIPPEAVLPFFFFTSIAGLGVIIIGFVINRKAIREKGLPYGVAIGFGYVAQLILFFPYPRLVELLNT